jgi:hypothetical protein
LVRLAAAVTAGATLMIATVGVAAAKEVSNEKYAKRVCGEINGVLDDIDSLDSPDTSDPATYQTEALAIADELISNLDAASAKLKKVSPEDGGKKVSKLFTKYLNEFSGKFQDLRDEFAAADPTSPAFTGDVTIFTVGVSNAPIGIDDPFAKLTDYQDLLGAFGDEKSCEDIVTVFGG